MNGLVEDVLRAIGNGAGGEEFLRIGIDVVSVADFATLMARPGGADFVANSFTESERDFCAERAARLAVRWAAKEAVAKAVGTGFRGLRPLDINVVHHPDGHPSVAPTNGSSWPDDADRWMWSISLCHEGDAAIAIAVGIINGGGGA